MITTISSNIKTTTGIIIVVEGTSSFLDLSGARVTTSVGCVGVFFVASVVDGSASNE